VIDRHIFLLVLFFFSNPRLVADSGGLGGIARLDQGNRNTSKKKSKKSKKKIQKKKKKNSTPNMGGTAIEE
jgi:hypothetical protein